MQISEVHDYARQLLKLHRDKARVVAAQKAIESEKRGDRRKPRIGGEFATRLRR
jgi:hypothetical protein